MDFGSGILDWRWYFKLQGKIFKEKSLIFALKCLQNSSNFNPQIGQLCNA